MIAYNPKRIFGSWKKGYSLDYHTLNSVFIGHDEFGHPMFDTTRSEVGELLYKLKYSRDTSVTEDITLVAVEFLRKWNPPLDLIVPAPSSSHRSVQPTRLIAESIARSITREYAECVTRSRDIPQLKNVFDSEERTKLLEDIHTIDTGSTKGKSILLFDDLFRSGATMNAITSELYDTGQADSVYVLTLTKTRSNL